MQPFSFLSFSSRIGSRQCLSSSCYSQLASRSRLSSVVPKRSFASTRGQHQNGSGQGKRRFLLFATAGTAAAGTTVLAFTDDIRNTYEATERTGRVVIGLAVCINEYVNL